MKAFSYILPFVLVSAALGQTAAAHRSNTQIINFVLDLQEKRILAAAEAMPEDKFGFTPNAGEFNGVRSFAEQLKHIAADNYLLGAGILGEKPPGDTGPDAREVPRRDRLYRRMYAAGRSRLAIRRAIV